MSIRDRELVSVTDRHHYVQRGRSLLTLQIQLELGLRLERAKAQSHNLGQK